MDMTKRQGRALLLCGIALAVVLQSLCAAFFLRVTYDDANTYLLATGHRFQFEQNQLTGQWVRAAEWKRLVQRPESLGFAAVTNDATRVDHHPPLYYWFLHLWTFLLGVHLAAGKIPSILFNVLTSIVLYRTCRLLECARGASALAAVLWVLSAPTMDAANETRQYCLLALMIALFLASLLRFVGAASKLNSFFLLLSTLGTVFTHYQSIVVIGIAAATACVLLARRGEYRRLAGLIGVLILSVAVFIALHPTFFEAFRLQSRRGLALSWHTLPDRIRRCIFSVLNLFVPTEAAWWIYSHKPALLAAAVAILAALVFYLRKTGLRGYASALRERTSIPAVVSMLSLAAIWTLYLLHLTLQHAMGRKYTMVVTPVLFVALGQMAHRLWRARGLARWAVVALIVGQALVVAFFTYRTVRASRVDNGLFDDPSLPIVLDNPASGIVLSVTWRVQDGAQVYVDRQDRVLADFPTIASGLPRLLYMSDPRMGNAPERRAAILRHLHEEGYVVRPRNAGLFEETDAYEAAKAPR